MLKERNDDFIVVALEIDENGDAEAVRGRAQDHTSKAVRWAVSPKAFTDELVGEFGPSVIVPPTAPIIVIDANQSRADLMGAGPKNAKDLNQAIEAAF